MSPRKRVTILILIDGFLQSNTSSHCITVITVTILILIDGFLQLIPTEEELQIIERHNPYFNRWFSAIFDTKRINYDKKKSQSLF